MSNISIDKGLATILVPSKLSSENAPTFLSDVTNTLKSNDVNKVIFDFNDCLYISSAGLRVLISIKKIYKDTSLINVNRDVYEVLEMTGFTNMVSITKKIREISKDGLTYLSSGATAEVYKDQHDNVVKIYKAGQYDEDDIFEEMEISKKAFMKGISTAIPFEVVKVNDSYATVYECLNAESLADLIHNANTKEEKIAYIKKFAELAKDMHSTDVGNTDFIDEKKHYLDYTPLVSHVYGEKYAKMWKELIEEIPDTTTFIHGDFHPANILSSNDELVLIDMGSASYGHPVFDIFDLAFIVQTLDVFDNKAFSGAPCETVLHMSSDDARLTWNVFFNEYFSSCSEQEKERKHYICYLYGCIRSLIVIYAFGYHTGEPAKKILKLFEELYSKWDHKFDL